MLTNEIDAARGRIDVARLAVKMLDKATPYEFNIHNTACFKG